MSNVTDDGRFPPAHTEPGAEGASEGILERGDKWVRNECHQLKPHLFSPSSAYVGHRGALSSARMTWAGA